MATKRLPMRQIREILRLKHDQQLSHRAIASACRVGLGTVADYLGRAKQAGLEWPLPADLDEAALEARLFPRAGPGSRERVAPDVERIHQELKRVGVTLHLLWEEYREANPKGYAYSQFCEIYRRWAQKLKPSMRQVRKCANLSWKLKRLQTLWFDGIGRNNIKPVRERSRDEESVTFGEKTQEEASTG